ncbi:MAG: S8 family serine peptidase [Acidobacteriota bacterium]
MRKHGWAPLTSIAVLLAVPGAGASTWPVAVLPPEQPGLTAVWEVEPTAADDTAPREPRLRLGGVPASGLPEALVTLSRAASAGEVAAAYGATVAGAIPELDLYLFSWGAVAAENGAPYAQAGIASLARDKDVAVLEKNMVLSDPETIRRRFPVAHGHVGPGWFSEQPAVSATRLDEAHTYSKGSGVLVAVIDTGVDPSHPLLRYHIAPFGRDFIDNDAAPWETANGIDEDGDLEIDESAGHGTFVAGLVLLAAPGARVLPYRAFNDDGLGTTFTVARAIYDATRRGADVINMSFAFQGHSPILSRLFEEATSRGVVLVAGAGNEGAPRLLFPARHPRVVAVAAVDEIGRRAEFSNFGSNLTVGAPGVELNSALDRGRFGSWSGTSMAAPLVSGTAALLRSLDPSLSPNELRDILRAAAAPAYSAEVPGQLDAAASVRQMLEGR